MKNIEIIHGNKETIIKTIDHEGNPLQFTLGKTHTNYRTTEHAEANGIEGRDYGLNRPGYRFTYEKAIKNGIEKAYKGKKNEHIRTYYYKLIELYANYKSEEADAFFNEGKAKYNKLSEGTKKVLANSDIILNSKEEAEEVIKTAQKLDILKELL